MFESAELGHRVAKDVYDREVPDLRNNLLDAQYDLLQAGRFPVVIIIGGVDGAGKGETVNLLNEWMDPRHIHTHAFPEPSDEERERPRMWRFWRALPPKGRVGILFGSWYTAPIVDRVMGATRTPELEQHIQEINRFEAMLVHEGALILKFWFHLSKDAQRKRLKTLEKYKETRWRVTDMDWARFKKYDDFRKVSELALRRTSSGHAPWIVVEGADARFRNLTVGRTVLAALRERLDEPKASAAPDRSPKLIAPVDQVNLLRSLDFSRTLPKRNYETELETWQGRLNTLARSPKFAAHSVVAVFEGSDAAGKGGAIRRATQAVDARFYKVVPIAAPTEEERAQPYLWRFWRHLPRLGRFAFFDRSWYGRVLVERVEGFCREDDWMRAYGEINDFEEQLVRHGTIVVKFWLAISSEEQLARFNARTKIGFKRFKITEEDWRNREKWDLYEDAVCDMIDRTSTTVAPWNVIPANDKQWARVEILKTLVEAISARW